MKTLTPRKGLLALGAFFLLILVAKAGVARSNTSMGGQSEPTACAMAPDLACYSALNYDELAAAELVGNDYLYLGELIYHPVSPGTLVPGSMAERFDDFSPVWAPESVHVVRIDRRSNDQPYRVFVRTHSTHEEGYFEVHSLTDVTHFLALANVGRLTTLNEVE